LLFIPPPLDPTHLPPAGDTLQKSLATFFRRVVGLQKTIVRDEGRVGNIPLCDGLHFRLAEAQGVELSAQSA